MDYLLSLALDPEQWNRRGVQQGVGPMCMRDIPELMSRHDDSHRAEIGDWPRWQRESGS